MTAENQARFGPNANSPTAGSVVIEGEIDGEAIQPITTTGLKGTKFRGLDTHAEGQGIGIANRTLSNIAKGEGSGNLQVTVISGRVSCGGCISRFGTYQTMLQSTAGPNVSVQVQFYSFGSFGWALWVP